jgi:peroxiredoxin
MTFRKIRPLAVAASLALSGLLASPSSAAERVQRGAAAPDFPPGSFSDGGHYKMADFEGKVVVLFFYEKDCPTCRGKIPARNKVVDQFKDKPVKFVAVAPGDTFAEAIAYTRETRLKMPSFSDVFGVMQTRYGFQISLHNIYQFVVVGPKGNVVANNIDMNPGDIVKALAGVTWKYRDAGYHATLAPIVDLLEWNQYELALARLKPLTKSGNKELAASATKLWDAVKADGKTWLDEAAKSADADPIKAYDGYKKVSTAFAGDDLGKQADAALKPLAKAKPVADELAARGMFDQMTAALQRAQLAQKPAFVKQAGAIAAKFPETATGKRAKALGEELAAATAE